MQPGCYHRGNEIVFAQEVINDILKTAGTTRKPIGMSNKEFATVYAQTFVSSQIKMPRKTYRIAK